MPPQWLILKGYFIFIGVLLGSESCPYLHQCIVPYSVNGTGFHLIYSALLQPLVTDAYHCFSCWS
jgi:hypothetical protein